MNLKASIDRDEIPGVVRHKDRVSAESQLRDNPVLRRVVLQVRDVCSEVAANLGGRHQLRCQALVDQKAIHSGFSDMPFFVAH